jgi:hypothetical protein
MAARDLWRAVDPAGRVGVAMLWLYPIASILSVAWVIAAWAFFAGFTLISLGIRLKRLQAVENGLESRSDETK